MTCSLFTFTGALSLISFSKHISAAFLLGGMVSHFVPLERIEIALTPDSKNPFFAAFRNLNQINFTMKAL